MAFLVEVEALEVRPAGEAEEEGAFVLLGAGVAALVMALQAEPPGHLRRCKSPASRGR